MSEMMRASDAERRATADRLGDALADGRLTLEEFTERVDAALGATYRGQLADLIEDLAAPATPVPSSPHLPTGPHSPRGPAMRTNSVFGDVRRRGAWTVPPQSSWHSVFGDIRLDLRQATPSSGLIEIEAGSVFGDVEVLVPPGVVVDLRGRVVFGDVRQLTTEPATPGAPRVLLTGRCFFGDVTVRDEPRGQRFWRRLKELGGGDPGNHRR